MIPDVDVKRLGLVLLGAAVFAAATWLLPEAISAVVADRIFGSGF